MYLKEVEIISSPTVSMEALFCTLSFDAHKGCDMATFDIPGAYPHADIPKDKSILMNLRGYFVDIMCQFYPEYEQHIGYENGEKVFCLLVLRAIYCCI